MSETMRMWVEIIFNITYLLVVWSLVILLLARRSELDSSGRRMANLSAAAFALLALGDTGHVGFRVWAYAMGGLESQVQLFGWTISLVGAGALATAITVTIFYMIMLEVWRVRFNRQYGPFEYFLLLAGVVRLFMLTLGINKWYLVVPEQPWSTIRNIPLMIQGLGLAYLVLRDALAAQDRTFKWVGVSILVSYACYLPVILFVQQAPMIGMLMIPKTMAYVAIGLLIYFDLYPLRRTASASMDNARSQV
jgi:hypothetical protein